MRPATLILAMLGLLTVGAVSTLAQEPPAIFPSAPGVAAATDDAAITVVRRPWDTRDPRWYRYERPYYPRYYADRPEYYWPAPVPYYGYYPAPYPGYYVYPRSFGFQYYGPRGGVGFGF
jgi:hypothetical protein